MHSGHILGAADRAAATKMCQSEDKRAFYSGELNTLGPDRLIC